MWSVPVLVVTGILSTIGVLGAAWCTYLQATKVAARTASASVEIARIEADKSTGLHVFDSERATLKEWAECKQECAELTARCAIAEANAKRVQEENDKLHSALSTAGLEKYLDQHILEAEQAGNRSALRELKAQIDRILQDYDEQDRSKEPMKGE